MYSVYCTGILFMRAMITKYAHYFKESNISDHNKMSTWMLAGLVGLGIAAFAAATMSRHFIDINTLDRKMDEPDFKVGNKPRRYPHLVESCRNAPVPYVKWHTRNQEINFRKIAFPSIMLSLVVMFVTVPWIMIKRYLDKINEFVTDLF